MPAVSTTPPTTISLAAIVFAVSRHVMKSAAHERNRQLMAFDNTLAVMKRAVVLLSGGVDSTTALTADIPVPKGRSEAEIGKGIPVTYVPARNTIFLSYALAWAEVLGAQDIFIGVTQIDYAGYPDCRPEYIGAYERMANLATKTGVEGGQQLQIHPPLIHLIKGEIFAPGTSLRVATHTTSS